MAYKTIVVHVDGSPHAPARFGLAATVAAAQGAHLIGAATTGISRFASPGEREALGRTVIDGYVDELYEQANHALAQCDQIAHAAGVQSVERRLIADEPEGALIAMGHFCDLLVVSQTNAGLPMPPVARDLPANLVLNSAHPVLIAPRGERPGPIGGRVLVAWNASLPATRALYHALPLLRRAAHVAIALFDCPPEPEFPRDHLRDLVAALARHQVRHVTMLLRGGIDAGKAVLALAAEQQAGLIVLGAYGHTRFQELVLGGVTETVLRDATVPVLVSH